MDPCVLIEVSKAGNLLSLLAGFLGSSVSGRTCAAFWGRTCLNTSLGPDHLKLAFFVTGRPLITRARYSQEAVHALCVNRVQRLSMPFRSHRAVHYILVSCPHDASPWSFDASALARRGSVDPGRVPARGSRSSALSCTSRGIERQGVGTFCRDFLCFTTVPCRPMLLPAHF